MNGLTGKAARPYVVLISGRGSNLQAIIEAERAGNIPGKLVAVLSNVAGASGLSCAEAAGIPTVVVPHREFGDRKRFEAALREAIDHFQPVLVALAGFMRVLSPEFVQHYAGRMLNIHPSLLPAFPGLDTHAQALAAGVAEHGATVHFVTPDVDAGPIVRQARVPVLPGDTAESLAERVLEAEHQLYPTTIAWFMESRGA